MSKYISKAEEIRKRVQDILDAFELYKGTPGWPDFYDTEPEIKSQYIDILTDIQILLFCDSAKHPLYIQAMNLKSQKDLEYSTYNANFKYADFEKLKNILSKYIQYREFLEAED